MQRKVIFECPAYKTLAQVERVNGLHPFAPGDTMAIVTGNHRGEDLRTIYTFGDVMSYALSYAECPLRAKRQAEQRGHKVYWANPNSVCISNRREAQKVHTEAEFGDVIVYAGKMFRIDRAPNNNVDLVELEPVEA